MKITRRQLRQIINEETSLIDSGYASDVDMLVTESKRLKKEGCTQEQINEGLLDIVKSLSGGFIETFKYQATIWLLSKLGMDPQGFLARAIANVIENADILEFDKYISSEGGCRELTNLIMDSLAETGMEPLVDGFVSDLGISPDSRLYATVREAMLNSLLDGAIAQGLENSITNVICGVDSAVGAIMDQMGGQQFGGGRSGGGGAGSSYAPEAGR